MKLAIKQMLDLSTSNLQAATDFLSRLHWQDCRCLIGRCCRLGDPGFHLAGKIRIRAGSSSESCHETVRSCYDAAHLLCSSFPLSEKSLGPNA